MHGAIASTINVASDVAGIGDRSIKVAARLDASATGNTVAETTNTQTMTSGDR